MPTKAELEKKIAALESENAQKESKLEQALADAAANEEKAGQLESQLEEQDPELIAKIEALEAAIAEKDAALEAVEKEGHNSEKVAELEKALKEKTLQLQERPSYDILRQKDARIAFLERKLDANNPQAIQVQGKFTSTSTTPEGEETEEVYQFKTGGISVRVDSRSGVKAIRTATTLSSEGLMQLANTGEIDPGFLSQSPSLAKLNQEDAQALLDWLVEIKYGLIEKVE